MTTPMRPTTSATDRRAHRVRCCPATTFLGWPGRVAAAAACVLAAAPAWADHPINGAAPPMSPLASALLYGGVTLVLGLVVIAIVRILFSDTSGES